MKHIVLYLDSMKPAGGIERVVSTLANKLIEIFKITILVKDNPTSFYPIPDCVEIISLQSPLILDMKKSRLSRIFSLTKHLLISPIILGRKIKELNPDYIYITRPYSCLEVYLARIEKKKIIISEHGAKVNFNIIYRTIKHLFYKKYLYHIVPTIEDYNWYKSKDFPSIYIPHFRSSMKYYKVNCESNIALNIGRLTDDKQQLLLIKIWKRIIFERKITNWKLQIVGDGENYNMLINYIRSNNLSDYISIDPPVKNVEIYYEKASVFVFASRSEGFPMTLIEAISFGLPCISFDCPTGPKEILENKSGILIPLNNEDAYMERLEFLLTNKDERSLLSERAFSNSNNWKDETILKKWKDIFN